MIGEINESPNTFNILNNGLNFIPTKQLNIKTIDHEINNNKFNINKFIQRQILNTNHNRNKIISKTPVSYQFTNNFINSITNNLTKLVQRPQYNINKQEYYNLQKIKNNDTIIIKPVDKNLGTAIINKQTYINLALKQHLSDTKTYEQLAINPLPKTIDKIRNIINNQVTKKKISNSLATKLLPPNNSRIGYFYILPKLHKNKLQSRPIISNINHPTSNISKFLHKVMLPTVTNSTTYVKNSYQLIEMTKSIKTNKHTIFITADIESLYTNIPQTNGEKIVTNTLYNHNNKFKPKLHKDSFEILLRHTLKNNIFSFNEQYYLQKHGTAMGTIMAPSYANLYLQYFEDKWLNNCKYKNKILLFVRYIDDILIIFNNDCNNIEEILNDLRNNIYDKLKLEINHNDKSCNFLDITLFNNKNTQNITTTIYTKPLNSHQYLHNKSEHPEYIINNLSYNLIYRIQKLCTSYSNKRFECSKLINNLLKQQHKYKTIKTNIKKIIHQQDNNYKKPKVKKALGPTIRITYTNQIKPLVQHIKTRWITATITKPQPPPNIIYKTNKTLKQILVRANLNKHQPITINEPTIPAPYKTTPCSKYCKICKFRDTNIQEHHNKLPTTSINCTARNIIYNIKCKRCHKEYIGESKHNAKLRIYQHLNNIKSNQNTIISEHFNKSNHNYLKDFSFNILLSTTMNKNTRRKLETTIIFNKQTLEPKGLNQIYSNKETQPSINKANNNKNHVNDIITCFY